MQPNQTMPGRISATTKDSGARRPPQDETIVWVEPTTQLKLCDASFATHHFPKHSHDYYVVGLISDGAQRFMHRGREYHTPPGGMIVLNPEDDHTGEPITPGGFRWRAIYPTRQMLDDVAQQLCRKPVPVRFARVRVDDTDLTRQLIKVHETSRLRGAPRGLREELLTQLLLVLVEQSTTSKAVGESARAERKYVLRACEYLRAQLQVDSSLNDLAVYVGVDAFRLIRAFNRCLGMPPFRYLESLRIRESQKLLERDRSLVDIAFELGFTDQSYFTRRFKSQIGLTPGQYRRMLDTSRR